MVDDPGRPTDCALLPDLCLNPDFYTRERDPQRILGQLSPEDLERFKRIGSAEEVFRIIKESPKKKLFLEKPFVFLFVKPQPSRRKTRQWAVIDSDHNLIVYDIATKAFHNHGVFNRIITDSYRSVKFDYGNKLIKKFTVKERLLNLGKILNDLQKPEQLPILQRVLYPYAFIPMDVRNTSLDQEMFDQFYAKILVDFVISPDLTFLRMLQHVPCAAQTIRFMGNAIETILIRHNRVPYVVNNLVPILFQNTPNTSQILRGESLITCIMGSIRSRLCSDYYEMLIQKIMDAIAPLNTAEEFIPVFIKVLNDNLPPPAIRWICSVLAKAAYHRFPDEPNSVFFSISNFFLLRGLGPKFAPKNASLRMKFSFLTMLFNLSPNSVIVSFIEDFKMVLSTVASCPDCDLDFGSISDEEYKEAIVLLHSSLMEQTSKISLAADKVIYPPLEHGILSTLRLLFIA